MIDFAYTRAASASNAIGLTGRYLGGGTNLVDLMREEIERPASVIDVSGLATRIDELDGGGLLIGAGVRNTALATDPRVRERFPVLSQAILNGASAQIRNMATVAGNLLQRTRCSYFYDPAAKCNKRLPGAGCDALEGFNRMHAVLGTSEQCIATHPSDMAVALLALDASVRLESSEGARTLPLDKFHRLPGDTPEQETELRPGELVTAIELPVSDIARRSVYRKVRDRSSYAFALISVAAALEVDQGQVRQVRIALGGVAHKPWRASVAETELLGQAATPDNFRRAAEAEMQPAIARTHNAFKIELARRVMADLLGQLAQQQETAS